MVKHKVPMTSTLAVYEPFVANRPTKDARTLEAMTPPLRDTYLQIRHEIDSSGSGPVAEDGFKHAMAFERAFVAAGGVLGAGVDPTGMGGALAGYGDQRNYELFIEAGFTPQQAVQIMTANGAKILGVEKQLGLGRAGQARGPGGAQGRPHRRSLGHPEPDRWCSRTASATTRRS